MKAEFLFKIKGGRQDGAIFGGYLFSFNHLGECTVYDLNSIEGEALPFAEFTLDKSDIIVPHSNSVSFGNEYFDESDEFPLLYTNIYNNYAGNENKLKGVCLVYRLQKKGAGFCSTLVQIIEIGFVNSEALWKSSNAQEDVRPYGNFTIDAEKGVLYAFTMRDALNITRYFSFDLPKVTEGNFNKKYNANHIVLQPEDIKEYFDCPYHHYVQGACCHNEKIYSLEGFTNNIDNPSAIRIIDTRLKKEIFYQKFIDSGIDIEPELIDFENNNCYYADHNGNMYKLLLD